MKDGAWTQMTPLNNQVCSFYWINPSFSPPRLLLHLYCRVASDTKEEVHEILLALEHIYLLKPSEGAALFLRLTPCRLYLSNPMRAARYDACR